MARLENPAPSEILAERMRQIDRAYKSRLRPRMTKAARDALERERRRQIRLAQAEFKAAKPTTKKIVGRKTVVTKRKIRTPTHMKPRRSKMDFPIGGVPHYVQSVKRIKVPAPDTPTWKYHDRETGRPIQPWDMTTHDAEGRAYDDDVEYFDDDGGWFDHEDYSYDDLEADWGGYHFDDTES